MSAVVHQYEDKLLEFAYGDLPAHEARAISAHLQTCARCSQSLAQINATRATMQKLPVLDAPDAGLESLLAYAEQTAHRNQNAGKALPWYRRWLVPVASVAALSVVGVVALRASEMSKTTSDALAGQMKEAKVAQEGRAERKKGLSEFAAKNDGKLEPTPTVAEPVAAAAPTPPPIAGEVFKDQQTIRYDDNAGKRGRSAGSDEAPPPPPAPERQSNSRRLAEAAQQPATPAEVSNAEGIALSGYDKLDDYSNAAQRGGRTKTPTVDAVQAAPTVNKGSMYGLGTGAGSAPAARAASVPQGAAQSAREEQAKAGEMKQMRLNTIQVARSEPTTKAEAEKPLVAPVPKPAPSATEKAKKSDSLPFSLGQPGAPRDTNSAEGDDSMAFESTVDAKKANADRDYARRASDKAVEDALQASRDASSRGDTRSAVAAALVALNGGASGYAEVEALKRLCDGFETLGDRANADRYCDRLIRDHGATAAARVVMERRSMMQSAGPAAAPSVSPAKKAAPAKARVDEPKPASAF